MAAGVVTVGRRAYASGLYWENSPSGRISQTAKEAARQPGHQADFYAVRAGNKNGRVPQFGLSHAADNQKAGMPVLAACMANQQPGSWAGAFRLREGIAVVVVRDDLIVPDGDQFFQDETEARDRLLQEMALGGLQRVYAPEPWGVPGADTMPVSLLLNDRTDVKLRQVAVSRGTMMAIGGGLLLLLLVLGVGWYIQNKNAEEEAARQAQMDALNRAKSLANQLAPGLISQKVEYPPPDPKWQKEPRPLELVDACKAALSQVNVGTANWDLRNVSCTRAGLVLTWVRTKGFSSTPEGAVVDANAASATRTVALVNLPDRGVEALKDPDEITRRYMAQNWPGDISRAPDDPLPQPPPDYKGPWNPPPAPWVKRSFTLTAPVLPWTLPTYLAGLPGVIINTMTFSGTTGTSGNWKIDGVIYENRH